MKTELPTKPGPYYWREKDGDEWEIAQINRCMDVYFIGCDMHYGLKETGGQWLPIPTAEELVELQAKAKAYDEGQKVFMTFDKHDRVRHLGDLKDYGRLVHMLRSELDSIVYTCRKVRVCKEVES